jgi:hypothetical protein
MNWKKAIGVLYLVQTVTKQEGAPNMRYGIYLPSVGDYSDPCLLAKLADEALEDLPLERFSPREARERIHKGPSNF